MNGNTKQKTMRGIVRIACVTALGLAFTVARPQAAHADETITPPPVPAGIEVDPPNEVVFVGHGVGTQNYVCLPSGSTFAWTLFTPEATLFNDKGKQLTTHFFSINPFEPGIIRATWEDSRDTSTVWAKAIKSSSDAPFVNHDAIAWVKLQVVGAQDGPTGGDRLTETTFIQRLNTVGGLAPATGCAVATDVGSKAFMPYTADYFFYEDASRNDRRDR
jgi:uncharacterized protein DUF3455